MILSSFLNLRKNIIEHGIIRIRPSYRTSTAKAKITNDVYIDLIFLLRNKKSEIVIRNIKKGSVKPRRELIINLGSKANKIDPNNAYVLEKNRLQNI